MSILRAAAANLLRKQLASSERRFFATRGKFGRKAVVKDPIPADCLPVVRGTGSSNPASDTGTVIYSDAQTAAGGDCGAPQCRQVSPLQQVLAPRSSSGTCMSHHDPWLIFLTAIRMFFLAKLRCTTPRMAMSPETTGRDWGPWQTCSSLPLTPQVLCATTL